MPEQFQHELIEIRLELDAIDDELLRLLNNRARISLRVGEIKRGTEIRAFVGAASEYLPKSSFAEVFSAVQIGEDDCGVVPVENSIEGPVQQNLDLLADGEVQVCGEVTIPVAHFLMAAESVSLPDVCKVYAHPQADGQCRR